MEMRAEAVVRIATVRVARRGHAVETAALLACAAVALGAPTASRGAAGVGASPAVSAVGSPPALPAQASPVFLAVPSGDAHLVLRAGPEKLEGELTWHVLYLASSDPLDLAAPEADARLESVAGELADAFRPLAELANVKRLTVTAIAGTPGANAAAERRTFAREEGGRWRAYGAARRGTIERLPPFGTRRHPEAEASARDAASGFLSDARRSDHDAAWARTSAVAKATTSRSEFERQLAAMDLGDRGPRATPYLAFPAALDRLLPGTFVEAWVACETASGVGAQALLLRLDDDLQWRVAGAVQLTAPRAPADMPTDDPARPPRSPRERAARVGLR